MQTLFQAQVLPWRLNIFARVQNKIYICLYAVRDPQIRQVLFGEEHKNGKVSRVLHDSRKGPAPEAAFADP